jgi:hypothetical protein
MHFLFKYTHMKRFCKDAASWKYMEMSLEQLFAPQRVPANTSRTDDSGALCSMYLFYSMYWTNIARCPHNVPSSTKPADYFVDYFSIILSDRSERIMQHVDPNPPICSLARGVRFRSRTDLSHGVMHNRHDNFRVLVGDAQK